MDQRGINKAVGSAGSLESSENKKADKMLARLLDASRSIDESGCRAVELSSCRRQCWRERVLGRKRLGGAD